MFYRSEFGFHKFFWRDAFIFVEGLDKVTFVIKSTGNCHFFNGNILCGKHLAGTLDSVIIQIVNRCTFRNTAEIAAEILWIHAGDSGQAVKINTIIVIFGYVGKRILNGIQSSCIRQISASMLS